MARVPIRLLPPSSPPPSRRWRLRRLPSRTSSRSPLLRKRRCRRLPSPPLSRSHSLSPSNLPCRSRLRSLTPRPRPTLFRNATRIAQTLPSLRLQPYSPMSSTSVSSSSSSSTTTTPLPSTVTSDICLFQKYYVPLQGYEDSILSSKMLGDHRVRYPYGYLLRLRFHPLAERRRCRFRRRRHCRRRRRAGG